MKKRRRALFNIGEDVVFVVGREVILENLVFVVYVLGS
jgi:hypothetical protein